MNPCDSIRARLEAATPGPWTASSIRDGETTTWIVEDVGRWKGFTNSISLGGDEATARFIAHAREDIGFLLAELSWLREGTETQWGVRVSIGNRRPAVQRAVDEARAWVAGYTGAFPRELVSRTVGKWEAAQ